MNDDQLPEREPSDADQVQLGFGPGGVPWYLLLFYLAFLTFFVWYALQYQLPDYLERGPIVPGGAAQTAPR